MLFYLFWRCSLKMRSLIKIFYYYLLLSLIRRSKGNGFRLFFSCRIGNHIFHVWPALQTLRDGYHYWHNKSPELVSWDIKYKWNLQWNVTVTEITWDVTLFNLKNLRLDNKIFIFKPISFWNTYKNWGSLLKWIENYDIHLPIKNF